MIGPAEHESIPLATDVRLPVGVFSVDTRRTRDRHPPVVFCASGGAGGFGGIYWLDDRVEHPSVEGDQP